MDDWESLAPETTVRGRRYNLGCGETTPDGWVNVDIKAGPGVDIIQDLNKRGWGARFYPAEAIHCADVIEHLNSCVAFMDECWDALVPGGMMKIKVGGEHNITFWRDPTHKRPYRVDSFDFFDPDTDMGTRYGHYSKRKWKILDSGQDLFSNPHLIMTPRKEMKEIPTSVRHRPGDGPKLEIALPYTGWILEHAVSFLMDGFPGYDITVNKELVGGGYDLTYHFPWHTLVKGRSGAGLDVAFFTHLNAGVDVHAGKMVEHADHIVTWSRDSIDVLASVAGEGVRDKCTCIYPGIDPAFQPRKIRIGLNGRLYASGRKRQWALSELVWTMDLSPFEFVILGSGWENELSALRIAGIGYQYYDEPDYDEYPERVQSLDYYLATGFREGCGRGVQEALACDVQVIAPATGIAADYQDGITVYDTIEDLRRILESLANGQRRRLTKAADWTWEHYVQQHEALFQRLLQEV
uniref:Glycosyltransferase n=1 Tax=viral metagenome TaxID=1070528 RepID=A0A6M3KRH1_9ZZZZ